MKKYVILCFCLILIFTTTNAQVITFNKVVDYSSAAQFARSVIPIDTTYFIFGFSQKSGQRAKINVNQLDLLGNILNQKIFGHDTISYYDGVGGSFKKSQFGGFYGAGSTDDQTSNDNFALYRLDDNGDSIFFKVYGDTAIDEIAYDVTELPDKGFVLVGYKGNYFNHSQDVLVIRTDSIGTELWRKTYGGSKNDGSVKVAFIGNNQIAIGGASYSVGNYSGDSWLFVINDSTRNIVWEKYYSGSWYSGSAFFNKTSDKGFIIYTNKDTLLSVTQSIAVMRKVDSFGNIQWEKIFNHNSSHYLWMARQDMDGNYIFCGDTYDENEKLVGLIGKLDSLGNLLWERTYYYNYGPSHYLADIQPTPDGGYIAVGMTHDVTQDAWVLKVDSMGCLTPGCDTVLNTTNLSNNFLNIDIYPNPASSHLTIQLELTNKSEIVTEIYDINGRLIYTKEYNSSDIQDEVDVTKWPKGIYLVRITADGEALATEKVVVQ